FIPINEITCTTIMSGFLKANKVKEMFDFYDNQIPKLALNNNINLQNKLIISLKSVGHLKMMETSDGNEIEKLSFHHQKYLDIFKNELYPDIKFKPTSISLNNVDKLIEVYVLLNKKSWMKAVKDVETILFYEPNYIHSLSYWKQDMLNKKQTLLDFNYFSTPTTCFMLRYLMTFQRQELKRKFKNGPIKILCGKSQFSSKKRLSGWKEDYESPKKKSIEDELNKWKIQIRLEQDNFNPAVWYLNEEDVQLLFDSEMKMLNVIALEKESIVIDLSLLSEPMICLEFFHFKMFVVCCCLFDNIHFKKRTDIHFMLKLMNNFLKEANLFSIVQQNTVFIMDFFFHFLTFYQLFPHSRPTLEEEHYLISLFINKNKNYSTQMIFWNEHIHELEYKLHVFVPKYE
ncbi:hypothetical protein RFI_28492, partial [Reticulomyxa filosa]